MKRLLPLFLALLLLSGCGSSEVTQTTPPTSGVEATRPAELISLYDADSEVEKQTGGAVRAYPLGEGAYTGLVQMGEKRLAVCADGTMTALQGDLCEVTATGTAELDDPANLIATAVNVTYYARQTREVVVMDTQLQELQRIAMPEDSLGDPVLLPNGEVFYCTETQIRALNTQTGISRLVREHMDTTQELIGSYFDGMLIGCRVTEQTGEDRVLFFYAQTGEVVYEDIADFTMRTWQEAYFGMNVGEPGNYVFGTLTSEPMCLYPQQGTLTDALPLGGVVAWTASEDGLQLAFYQLTTGKKTAQVTLSGVGQPQAILADEAYLWVTADGVLYRWDIAASQTGEETVYSGPRYTAKNPDAAGLAACQTRAQSLQSAYGIELAIWEEARNASREYTLEEEYRVSAIHQSLDALEAVLASFPEGFLEATGDVSVMLVGSLKNGEPAAQYWEGSRCNILIASQETAKYFLWGLGFAIDTHVLVNCRDFDTWDNRNPDGFTYTYDYEENALREDWDSYSEDFINQQSMSFPTEDRSWVFAYGSLEEGAEYFTHKTLQKKLTKLCEGIRDAYELEDSTEVFFWEQYLKTPLAAEE